MNERMRIFPTIAALALVVLSALTVSAQAPANGAMNQADVQRIIRAFTAKEVEFFNALNSYSFKRDALVQKIGMGGQVTGEYHRVSTFTFDDQGNRFEKISAHFAPAFLTLTFLKNTRKTTSVNTWPMFSAVSRC